MTHARRKPKGEVRTYGVLVGRVKDGRLEPAGNSPHYEIWIDGGGSDYRVAVNVRSVDGSDVLAYYDRDYRNPTKLDLATLARSPGFATLATGPGGKGLDYLRDDLFPVGQMSLIPEDGRGVTLHNLLDAQIGRAKLDRNAVAIAFGEFFRDRGADQTFGFSPEQGVHDIHMMQGNEGSFADDNRVNGDGALFLRFAGGETVALFVRFTVQRVPTSDTTGAPTS
ncbi:MAG TPA: DUF2278 family protein [Polyangiaceae bacterium]|nr:DUF2278 family protein [Polyangiaceae bacterium]